MGKRSIVWKILGGMAIFAVGVTAGRLMNITLPPAPEMKPSEVLSGSPTTPAASPEALPPAALPVPPQRGPFSYKFTPGEKLHYRLTTSVTGEGMEDIGADLVDFGMTSDFSLTTLSVAGNGDADLRLDWDAVSAKGNFMGMPYDLNLRGKQVFLDTSGKPTVDTAHGVGSTKGIPQLEFFSKPTMMTVSPNGQIQSLMGPGDWGTMLSTVPSAALLEFPSDNLQQGMTWESSINLPIPGIATAPRARLLNAFVGYQDVAGRNCGVIQQEVQSEQTDGALNAPKSAMGEAVSFTMPKFKLSGRNQIYFDTADGQLVASSMDLKLVLNFGQANQSGLGELSKNLDAIKQVLSGELPDEEKGANSADTIGQEPPKDLLDLTLNITGGLTLVSPSQAAMAESTLSVPSFRSSGVPATP